MANDEVIGWAHESGAHRVELIDIGEGVNGDFDPTNPDDEPVLCVDHFQRDVKGQWKLIDEDFTRTTVPVSASADRRLQLLKDTLEHIRHQTESEQDLPAQLPAQRKSQGFGL